MWGTLAFRICMCPGISYLIIYESTSVWVVYVPPASDYLETWLKRRIPKLKRTHAESESLGVWLMNFYDRLSRVISIHTKIWKPLIECLYIASYIRWYYQHPVVDLKIARDTVFSIVSAMGEPLISINCTHYSVLCFSWTGIAPADFHNILGRGMGPGEICFYCSK